MYVTRQNMANVVATVSKQLENVHETLAYKKAFSKKLENLDFKVEEQKEITQLIANDVNEVKSNLSQIGFAVELIHQMVSGLEGKVDLIESKQDPPLERQNTVIPQPEQQNSGIPLLERQKH
ncbi:hypothetical protein D8674_035835 [Pyrus ussuriensis x Pyrus communis]|uniref:DUF1664 domain-containing protein n=1 Tax=Pyrus ussuriensis x Pyrus communis TaxID=2448454 RepID=A0A5N5GDH5_9ROSA|nr:hypothetical protein D8674_035835 [Pyrus ussuriensis x Pyrus communis]